MAKYSSFSKLTINTLDTEYLKTKPELVVCRRRGGAEAKECDFGPPELS